MARNTLSPLAHGSAGSCSRRSSPTRRAPPAPTPPAAGRRHRPSRRPAAPRREGPRHPLQTTPQGIVVVAANCVAGDAPGRFMRLAGQHRRQRAVQGIGLPIPIAALASGVEIAATTMTERASGSCRPCDRWQWRGAGRPSNPCRPSDRRLRSSMRARSSGRGDTSVMPFQLRPMAPRQPRQAVAGQHRSVRLEDDPGHAAILEDGLELAALHTPSGPSTHSQPLLGLRLRPALPRRGWARRSATTAACSCRSASSGIHRRSKALAGSARLTGRHGAAVGERTDPPPAGPRRSPTTPRWPPRARSRPRNSLMPACRQLVLPLPCRGCRHRLHGRPLRHG